MHRNIFRAMYRYFQILYRPISMLHILKDILLEVAAGLPQNGTYPLKEHHTPL